MTIRTLFIITLLAYLSGCSVEHTPEEVLPNLTTYSLENIPEIELIKDESFKGAQNAGINKIGDIAVDEQGNVYFVDVYKSKVQVVDADGSPSGTIGRAGGRPGEFQKPGQIKVMNGGLYAYDEDLATGYRFSLNDYDLEESTQFSAGNIPVDSLSSATPFKAIIQPDGYYLTAFQVVKSPQDRRLFWYKVNSEGEIIGEQIITFQNKPLFVDEGQNGMIIMMMPYERETVLTTDSQGRIYTINTEKLLIKIHDADGKYLKAWQYPFENRKLNETDAVDMFTNVDIRRAIRGDDLPTTWPAVAHVLVDDEDRLWVATITGNLEKYRWYVIEPGGEVAGSFELNRKQEIRVIKDNVVYTKEYNARQYAEEVNRYSIRFR